MDLIVDAVAQLVSALRSVGLQPPVAIVLKSEDEVRAIETGAKEIWENLFARAQARAARQPLPTRIWGVQFRAERGHSDAAAVIHDLSTDRK
jgi:hypothetical protein